MGSGQSRPCKKDGKRIALCSIIIAVCVKKKWNKVQKDSVNSDNHGPSAPWEHSSARQRRHTAGQCLVNSHNHRHGHSAHFPAGTSGEPVNGQTARVCRGHCSIMWMRL
ncbi:hypothetical protein GWK47_014099 [Chionoecetes opilio]|uniref:Uncharacterized protein n=1 Tax=Chionoecetes opilio TaxID=41210 RepID=A0A8J5CJ16_CHIOP|nr:hypothetical protein GWK47_014099 [Chionoecetes opilio]